MRTHRTYKLLAALGICACVQGCYLSQEARHKVIEQEAAEAESRADQRLAADLKACGGDPECRRAAHDAYEATMREIQATRDARIDAWLQENRE